jgi:hypothetical protein
MKSLTIIMMVRMSDPKKVQQPRSCQERNSLSEGFLSIPQSSSRWGVLMHRSFRYRKRQGGAPPNSNPRMINTIPATPSSHIMNRRPFTTWVEREDTAPNMYAVGE